MSSPLHKHKAPLLKTFWWQICFEGIWSWLLIFCSLQPNHNSLNDRFANHQPCFHNLSVFMFKVKKPWSLLVRSSDNCSSQNLGIRFVQILVVPRAWCGSIRARARSMMGLRRWVMSKPNNITSTWVTCTHSAHLFMGGNPKANFSCRSASAFARIFVRAEKCQTRWRIDSRSWTEIAQGHSCQFNYVYCCGYTTRTRCPVSIERFSVKISYGYYLVRLGNISNRQEKHSKTYGATSLAPKHDNLVF